MVYQETFVRRNQHRIYVREHPGEEPTIILMHGFPDNLHLYDRLLAYLSPPRRVIAFDFLGWGASNRPVGYPYTASSQVGELDAVITQTAASACNPRRARRPWSACDLTGPLSIRSALQGWFC
jgi:haloalkane dehalogenase